MSEAKHRYQARAIATLWRCLAGRRLGTLWRLARLAGPLVHRFSRREREVTEINLREVFPFQDKYQEVVDAAYPKEMDQPNIDKAKELEGRAKAEQKKLDVRFEVLNAGRESVNSNDIEAIVREEALPLSPDLVFYYEGGNQLDLSTVVNPVPQAKPQPGTWWERFLRDMAQYSALARRGESLMVGKEWPRPDYELKWPPGLSETDPDLTRKDLPVHLNSIMDRLDAIRGDLAKVDGLLSIGSFHWLVKDGLELNASRYKPIMFTLNVTYFPYRYRYLERLTKFENTVFAKYSKEHGLPFVDVARQMPNDPDLFSDAIHNTPAGVKLRGWIVFNQLLPVIEAKLKSGEWPKPASPDAPPLKPYKPRLITFDCKKAS